MLWVRQIRWPEGIVCPRCGSKSIIKRGKDEIQSERQRYCYHDCHRQFDGLTDRIFASRHQPLQVWGGAYI